MRITPQQAIERLMGGRRRAKGATPIVLAHTEKHSRVDRLFVFEIGEGFVVTPADDSLPTILGVCDESAFDNTNPAMADWLGGLAKEIAWYQRGEEEPLNMDTPSGRVTIAPLVKAKWNQTSPYNKNLNFGDGNCYVGCCAVATAEIMHHWMSLGYERGSKAIPSYTTSTKKYKVSALPSIPFFDVKNMTTGKPKTTAQINAVATLMEYVAKSIKSDFKTTGTGAYNSACVTAMTKYFRMGNPTQVLSSSMSASKFEEAIYNELAEGRPVYMSGAKAANAGGHTFVCDGYDVTTGLFHFNWGWGGSGDGYFALNALTPTGKNYSFNKRAIVKIQPTYKLGDVNGDGKINVSDVMETVNLITEGKYDERADINSDGKVTVADVMDIVNKILSTETQDDIPQHATAPLTPSVGDEYKNTSDNNVYECTALGKGTQIAIQLNDDMTDAPYNQTYVVTFNEHESITFSFANISTFEGLKASIVSTLTKAGYVEDSIKNVKSGIGKFCFYPSGATYLDIASKSQGNFRSSVSVSNMGNTSAFRKIYATWGSAGYQNSEGQEPSWKIK